VATRPPSKRRIAEINAATLDTLAGVQQIRAALAVPRLWAFVAPDVKNALTASIYRRGGELDEALEVMEAYLKSRSPWAGPQTMSALDYWIDQLDRRLEAQRESAIGAIAIDEAQRASTDKARHVRGSQSDVTAERYQREIDALRAERPTLSKTRAMEIVAGRQTPKKTLNAVRKRLKRHAERIK
jgi:hypothetical protein